MEASNKLIERLLHFLPEAGCFPTAISGLKLTRWNESKSSDACFYAPSISVIVQGQKESAIGNEQLRYGAGDCLVNGVDIPSQSTIIGATIEKPLLAISLDIDKKLAVELATALPPAAHALVYDAACDEQGQQLFYRGGRHLGVSVARVTDDVFDAFCRLLKLLDKPEQRAVMAPLLIKEIMSRVFMSPQGEALKMIYAPGSHSHQVAQAISWLRAHYRHTLRIDVLAAQVGMAISTFHRQFKHMTSVSPLQFQKYLRLYEAQRLMLTESMDAGNAGRRVGYESVQQFSREYKRMFGEPPRRNVQRLRQE